MNTHALHLGDCLEIMATLPDASIDCVLTDPPYGTTACKWDSVIPFEPMWKELKRIAKPKAAICLFGSQPFTSALVMSNVKDFRYEVIWQKDKPSNFAFASRGVMKFHESILVFYESQPFYSPQMTRGRPNHSVGAGERKKVNETGANTTRVINKLDGLKHPQSVMRFNRVTMPIHPTQKPVELLRYLIRTYTLENETVLDFTMGSGSTGMACELENRKFIGIEKDPDYFAIAEKRIAEVRAREPLFMEAVA